MDEATRRTCAGPSSSPSAAGDRVSPNPMVGAVVVRDGAIVGEGWHEGPGTAARGGRWRLRAAGDRARGATARTSRSSRATTTGRRRRARDALIEAGVARVVAAPRDPNPSVDGARVRRAARAPGIEVDDGVARPTRPIALNEAFATTSRPACPFVDAEARPHRSTARSRPRDGIVAVDHRRGGARRRATACGRGRTPSSSAPAPPSPTTPPSPCATRGYRGRQPLRVVVDCRAGCRRSAGCSTARRRPSSPPPSARRTPRVAAWTAAGAEVASASATPVGGVSIPDLTDALGKRDVQGVLIEGGPTLAWSAVREGVVDRVVLYLAPLLVGGAAAPGALEGAGFAPDRRGAAAGPIASVGPDRRATSGWRRDVHRDR